MCLYFSTGHRFSNLDPGLSDSPCCSPPDIRFPHCFDHKRGGATPLPLPPQHRTATRQEPRARPTWLLGPSTQCSQLVAPPASVCTCLAMAEPEAGSAREWGAAPACRGSKLNIKILGRLTGLLQHKLQPDNNSTYSVLACLPSPYVFSLYQ